MSRVTCSNCGTNLPDERTAADALATACSCCGSTAITIQLSATIDSVSAVRAAASLALGGSERGWRSRWEAAQRRLAQLIAPPAEALSAPAIQAAYERLLSFFVQTYALKDQLKAETTCDVEAAIDQEPDLGLLADLANLEKHGRLDPNRKPRSGAIPRVTSRKGVGSLATDSWRLEVEIDHGGQVRDGLQVAQAVVEAWGRALVGWGLI